MMSDEHLQFELPLNSSADRTPGKRTGEHAVRTRARRSTEGAVGSDGRVGVADPLENWADFAAAARARLECGRMVYHDRSFSRSPEALLGEIREELLDVATWSFILWHRLLAAEI